MLDNDNKHNYYGKRAILYIEEIAKMLKVAYLTVYCWIQDSRLKVFKAGKQYRVSQKDLNKFIKKQETKR